MSAGWEGFKTFAALGGLGLGVVNLIRDHFRNRAHLLVRAHAGSLYVRNSSAFAVYTSSFGVIAANWESIPLNPKHVVGRKEGDHSTAIEARQQLRYRFNELGMDYDPHIARARFWFVQLQTGEYFTNLPWWNYYARFRAWRLLRD